MWSPWIHLWTGITLVVMCVIGCSASDERLVELSQQSVARQAEQNHEIAQQSQKVAEATHDLVQADARAWAELIEAQHSLEAGIQAERDSLDQQRQNLEKDRQSLANAREREPVIAQAIGAAACLLAVTACVVFCIYLVRTTSSSPAELDLNELLLTELTADQPSFLLPAPAPRPDQLPAPTDQRQS
jgi:hypothetical protein